MTKTDGSALLVVLCIMTALITYSMTTWYSTMFVAESVRKRVVHEQQVQLLKALLDWGVLCGKTHYDTLLQQQSSTLECDAWPTGNASGCAGKISFKALHHNLHIIATLHKPTMHMTKEGSCMLIPQLLPDKTKTFVVKDMQWS